MGKKKQVESSPHEWEHAVLVLDGTGDRVPGETVVESLEVQVRRMTYDDYRKDCDLVARSHARRFPVDRIREEIQSHRAHSDEEADAPAAPAFCVNWTAAHAWADSLEAVIK